MRNVVAAALALLLLTPAVARADDPKRPVPDYDGRPPPPATPGAVALWIPRILLFPPYLVSEYVLRRPLGALVTLAEEKRWATTLYDFFTFGPDHKAGIVPTAFFDFGTQPSVGLYFFWDDAFAKKNDLRAHVSYFGSDWVAGALTDRVHVGEKSTVSATASWLRRPDFVYAGEGPRTLESARSRFLAQKLDAYASFDLRALPALTYSARVGARNETFRDTAFFGDPSVDESVAAGRFAVPASYRPGYTAVYEHVGVTLDSRADVAESGVRVSGYVEQGNNTQVSPSTSWLKYGGLVGGAVDVWDARVLSLAVKADFVDPLQGGPIPFTEEVVWGGLEPLSGFLPGRLHGRSAAAATLAYSWPIWVWLDGSMQASVGNVFDAGLRDFDPKLLRVSSGIGVKSTGNPDHRLELLVGFGTETFDQGAKVDSFRLVVGGTNGF